LNISLPSKPRFTQWYTLLKIYHRISACVSVLPVRITCIPKLITVDLKRFMNHPSPYRVRNTIRKLVIKQFSAVSCYFLLLRSKYFPKLSVLEMPYSIFLPYCEIPSLTSYRTKKELCELRGFHNYVTEDSGLPACDGAMLCGCRRLDGICCLHSSGSSGKMRRMVLLISGFIFLQSRRGGKKKDYKLKTSKHSLI